MKYKHITIEARNAMQTVDGRVSYRITNNKTGHELGLIAWESGWRQYVVEFNENCIFSASCLSDIIKFITEEAGKE